MKKLAAIFVFFAITHFSYSQEVIPVYTDYLSDNVFLVHPAAAGIGNCGKIRLTHRQQWFGTENAPSLQTLSFHTKIAENSGVGGIIFNDRNGFHEKKGIQATYAHHINFAKYSTVNLLSFGLSGVFVHSTRDESDFLIPDPVISQGLETAGYFNADFGMAYHFKDWSSYLTVKNLVPTTRNLQNDEFESLNLRRYILYVGHYLGRKNKVQIEPSIMAQYIEETGEAWADFNIKAYKNLQQGQLWGGVSLRKSFEENPIQGLNQLSVLLGMNYKKYMAGYTYTHELGDITFQNGGFHQLTIGINVFCKESKALGCPNLNQSYEYVQ